MPSLCCNHIVCVWFFFFKQSSNVWPVVVFIYFWHLFTFFTVLQSVDTLNNKELRRAGWAGRGIKQKARRELCKQPRAVEKVHARVHVRRNRRSTRPLHGHLIKTTCRGLYRYWDCNFASQWPFTISCTVAFDSRAVRRPSASAHWTIFGQNLLLFLTPQP